MIYTSGIQKWHELDGDNTLALEWPLNKDSHVWEIGGFEGRWVQQMWDKFHCHITVFEPQMWAVERLHKRFEGIKKIDIRPYGLWVEDATLSMGAFGTDGCGPLTTKEPKETGQFKAFYGEMGFDPLFTVDVCLMNIEGGEYLLLPEFIRTGAIDEFNHFWCQFHPREEGRDIAAEEIFDGMSRTHDLMWNCYPTAVAWRKR